MQKLLIVEILVKTQFVLEDGVPVTRKMIQDRLTYADLFLIKSWRVVDERT